MLFVYSHDILEVARFVFLGDMCLYTKVVKIHEFPQTKG